MGGWPGKAGLQRDSGRHESLRLRHRMERRLHVHETGHLHLLLHRPRPTVSANGSTTVEMPSMPSTGGSTPPVGSNGGSQSSGSGSPGTGSGGSLFAGGSRALKLLVGQHGSSVHGSIDVSQAGAGGELEVALLATGASLAKAHRPSTVRVGHHLHLSVQAGVMSFTVPLTARGKAALRRHRRLTLTVRIVLTPVHGAAATVTKSVVLWCRAAWLSCARSPRIPCSASLQEKPAQTRRLYATVVALC